MWLPLSLQLPGALCNFRRSNRNNPESIFADSAKTATSVIVKENAKSGHKPQRFTFDLYDTETRFASRSTAQFYSQSGNIAGLYMEDVKTMRVREDI